MQVFINKNNKRVVWCNEWRKEIKNSKLKSKNGVLATRRGPLVFCLYQQKIPAKRRDSNRDLKKIKIIRGNIDRDGRRFKSGWVIIWKNTGIYKRVTKEKRLDDHCFATKQFYKYYIAADLWFCPLCCRISLSTIRQPGTSYATYLRYAETRRESETTLPVFINSHQKQIIVPAEPHCMLIFELTNTDTVLPVILQKLRHRGVEITEQCALRDKRIVLDCLFEKPDRIYQLVLLAARIPGVISVERMISKGIITPGKFEA